MKNVSVFFAENSGPPSLEISRGTPNVEKSFLNAEHGPFEPDSAVPWRILDISVQHDNRSAAIR